MRSLEPAKLRVWAGVWRAETSAGVHYAKQNCQLQAFEATLVPVLSELAPHRVVPVTAADPDRGLLLTPDQGPVFADTVGGDDLDTWGAVLAAGAHLQREVAPAVDRLSAAGMTTIAPADAPAYVDRRVAELASRPADDPMVLSGRPGGGPRGTAPHDRRVGRPGRGAGPAGDAEPRRPARAQRLPRRGRAALLRLRRRPAHRAARRPADPAQRPLRTARHRPGRPAAVAGRGAGAGGLERPGSAPGPARCPPCRPPARSAGTGRELGPVLRVDGPTPSWPSGASRCRGGWRPSSSTRRWGGRSVGRVGLEPTAERL